MTIAERTTSVAVWDVPMPVVAGGRFTIKVGARAASGRALTGTSVEVTDGRGTVVASGTLGEKPWPGTEALHWAALEVPSPPAQGLAEYAVRLVPGPYHEATTARFSVMAAAKPEHTVSVTVKERDTAEALAGVEIRLGPFRARTDGVGRAEVRVCKGAYQLQLWRTAHVAEPRPVTVDGDRSIALTMTHVPEEHPDARWVR